jgi:D-lyxose ketol-isomerase
MITKREWEKAQQRVLDYFKRASIALTPKEIKNIEIADFGLGRLEEFGLQLVVYINTERICAKEMVLFPYQICPEHKHPPIKTLAGKEETFRCRWGKVYLYIPGEATKNPFGRVPLDKKPYFNVWKEIKLSPGEQYTISPDTLHWFQGGEEGAIVSEFSTRSVDEKDIFTDPHIDRIPRIID